MVACDASPFGQSGDQICEDISLATDVVMSEHVPVQETPIPGFQVNSGSEAGDAWRRLGCLLLSKD